VVKNTINPKTAGSNHDTGNQGEKMAKMVLNTWLCHGGTVVKNKTHNLKSVGSNPAAITRGE
jgi:hypothetical protein